MVYRTKYDEETGILDFITDNISSFVAGYCVITYLLGVGDRHLDNLLLSPDGLSSASNNALNFVVIYIVLILEFVYFFRTGNLFHVDFGFILGRDPKPFPPPMKLCREMVEAMGGANSPQYQKFKSYCYTAFSILRKNANLILNLFALMVDANIPDIKIEPDKAVMKVIKYVFVVLYKYIYTSY